MGLSKMTKLQYHVCGFEEACVCPRRFTCREKKVKQVDIECNKIVKQWEAIAMKENGRVINVRFLVGDAGPKAVKNTIRILFGNEMV